MSEKSFVACFFDSFRKYKYIFIFTVLLSLIVFILSWITFDTSNVAAVQEMAYVKSANPEFLSSFMAIIPNNIMMNIQSYILSVFLGFGAFIEILNNLGMVGSISAASAAFSGDTFIFLKLTLIHALVEEIAIVINAFASFILVYFILLFLKDSISSKESNKIKSSWEKNKIHLKYSLSVFVFALIIMFIAGILESTISIPIGNMIAGV